MAIVIIPPLKPVPPGATHADRQRMFEEYKDELNRLNPHLVRPDGTKRSLLGCLVYLFTGR